LAVVSGLAAPQWAQLLAARLCLWGQESLKQGQWAWKQLARRQIRDRRVLLFP
jgi:hypothetical protein